MGALLEETEKKLREALQELGLELVKICRVSSKKGGLLRIIIHKSGGVSISDCERATEASRRILEAQNESCGIEVSSPGLDEPLRNAQDFSRRIGEEATLYLSQNYLGKLQIEGRIMEVTEEAVTVEAKGENISVPIQSISVGKLMIKI